MILVNKPGITRYIIIIISITAILISIFPMAGHSQDFLEVARGFEEFKWGVKAYYSGFFNRAVFSFERALSRNPEDNLAREWLGKAYYMSGMEDTALSLWQSLADSGVRSASLLNKIEIIRSRRRLYDLPPGHEKLVVEKEIAGALEGETVYFRRPGGVLPLSNGDFLLASYATNEIIHFNINGRVLRRIRGGLGVLNRPFDIIKTDAGTLFVSEYGSDQIARININGNIEKKFGSSGRGDGELMGPQYLADNGRGYIYVSDWGNRRIAKFDYNGTFILSFGTASGSYRGLRGPTGLAVLEGRVYVADSRRNCIDVFDESGNFIETIGRGMFNSPEGLSVYDENSILVADDGKIIIYNVNSGYAEEIFRENSSRRIGFARFTVNNDLIATDFDGNRVMFLSPETSVYEGLFVRIDRVIEDNFPVVRVVANVQTRTGQPVAGLESVNFRVSEEALIPDTLNLLFASHNSDTADISVVVEESLFMTEQKNKLMHTINEIYRTFSGGDDSIRIIAAGEDASIIADRNTPAADVAQSIRRLESYSRSYSPGAGIRLGGSELVTSLNKKAVILVSSGRPAGFDFSRYRLTETAAYLRNNGIRFYYIYLDENGTDEELEYICRETGGRGVYVYKPGGLGRLGEEIRSSPGGYYLLEYVSKSFDQHGRRYIPLRLEAAYNLKSGRDEAGYFTHSN